MNERNLLDIIISILPGLRPLDRVSLLHEFDREEDLVMLSKEDIEKILGHGIKSLWNMDEIRGKAERIDSICRRRSINWVSFTEIPFPPLLREMYDPPPVIF